MNPTVFDWQRASWLPLLGLDRDSTVLTIGCGHGCISAALAHTVKQVFAMDAVAECVELTRARMAQENLSNLRLVQANPLEPPFPGAAFDLVVVNGVLERMEERQSHGAPGNVQLAFLKRVALLLKPAGVLLIGTENRLSWRSLSGKKPSARAHSRAGYQKLLSRSGFKASVFYWSDPAHDQPYDLVALEDAQVAEHVERQTAEPWLAFRREWKAALITLAARLGALKLFVPEFVILAARDDRAKLPGFWRKIRESIPALAGVRNPVFGLTTRPRGGKSVIRVFEAGSREPCCILKTHTGMAHGPAVFERESNALRILREHAERAGPSGRPGRFTAPSVVGTARIGSFTYCAESVAGGVSLAGIIFRESGPRQLRVLEKYLPRCLEAAAELARMLRHDVRVAAVDPAWWEAPAGAPAPGERLSRLARESETAGWVQHGDFTAENIWIGVGDSKPAVIDWEHLFRGGPPLYDVFTLLLSVLPAVSVDLKKPNISQTPWVSRFEEAFFGRGQWAGRFRAWLSTACEKLEVSRADVWPMFLQFLILRTHYVRERGSWLAVEHLKFVETALDKKEDFLLAGPGCPPR